MSETQRIVEEISDLMPHGEVFDVMCTEENTIQIIMNASARQLEEFRDAIDEAIEREREFPAAMRN